MTSKNPPILQGQSLDLFSQPDIPGFGGQQFEWPKADEFPLNLGPRHVQDTILKDLHQSPSPLLVVGYASLDRIIDFVAQAGDQSRPRLLFGNEPFPSRRESFELRQVSFPKEVERYWLRRGISLRLSAKLIQCLERLKSGHTRARYIGDLHAKIYCGEEAASVGSSNFTQPGMQRQLEANTRFSKRQHKRRYEALVQIAENYWQMGEDYTPALISLLEKLLRWVHWREALARACAELLEGDWAQAYWRNASFAGDAPLWPSQKQGIAQALYILSHQGSVLVADTTGSGKTRMGVHLIGALMEDILGKGRIHRGKALMICPPAVLPNWEWESNQASVPPGYSFPRQPQPSPQPAPGSDHGHAAPGPDPVRGRRPQFPQSGVFPHPKYSASHGGPRLIVHRHPHQPQCQGFASDSGSARRGQPGTGHPENVQAPAGGQAYPPRFQRRGSRGFAQGDPALHGAPHQGYSKRPDCAGTGAIPG